MRTGVSLDEFKTHMNKRIPALMKLYKIPGCSIALVKDGEIAWTQAYGYADVESGRALTTDTPMSVQSITKSITAWGIMRLAEKGLIDLDAPVSQYLKSWQFPQSDYPTEKITIRQLLSHTAGMPLGDFNLIYAPDEAMPSSRSVMTREAVPIREAGAGFSYSNAGYNLLEILIEDVTGQSFSEYLRSEVFLPLGMESAAFEIGRAKTPYPPTGYDLSGKPVPVYLYPSKASGGLFATAEDIARFAAAGLKENLVLKSDSVKQMYQPECYKTGIYSLVFEAYGLGHYIEKLPNSLSSISHGGQGKGIMTHFQSVPETGDAIVILTNSQKLAVYRLCAQRLGKVAGISVRRNGKDHLGALWALCCHRYAELCKFIDDIESDCRFPLAKADGIQTASGRDGSYSARCFDLVPFTEVLICHFCFSGSVWLARGSGVHVLHFLALIRLITCPPEKTG